MAKEQFYRIDFINWSEDYNYTIVRTIEDVMDYLKLAEADLNTGLLPADAPTSVKITGVKMSEYQYSKWLKCVEV